MCVLPYNVIIMSSSLLGRYNFGGKAVCKGLEWKGEEVMVS